MLSFDFNNEKYTLPQSWEEVTLNQLKQWVKLNREELSDFERAGKAVSVFSGIDYKTISECESRLVLILMSHLDFLSTEADLEPIQHFEFSGQTFYVNTLQDSIFKEFATFSKIESDFREKPEDAYALKLAVLCRKEGETFNDIEKKLTDRAKLFENLDATTVLKINAFFFDQIEALKSQFRSIFKAGKSGKGERERINSSYDRKYGWLSLAYTLAGSPLHEDQIFNKKTVQILRFFEWQIDTQKRDETLAKLDKE